VNDVAANPARRRDTYEVSAIFITAGPRAHALREGLIMRKALLAMLVLSACGTTTRFAATNSAPHPLMARPSAAVEVFVTGLPQRQFVEVGIIQARQSSEFSNDEMPDIIAEMRTEAGKRGCDGLVINGASDTQQSSTYVSHHEMSSSTKTLEGFWGACIVFVNDPPPIAAAGPMEAPEPALAPADDSSSAE
jgi:hypothetical protein